MTTQTKRNQTKRNETRCSDNTFHFLFGISFVPLPLLRCFSFLLSCSSSFMVPWSEPFPMILPLVCANNRFVCLSLISFDCSLGWLCRCRCLCLWPNMTYCRRDTPYYTDIHNIYTQIYMYINYLCIYRAFVCYLSFAIFIFILLSTLIFML